MSKTDTDALLAERGSRYGDFHDHASITQSLKESCRRFRAGESWQKLSPAHREAIDMILHKVGRILNGDPNYTDSWADIAGYATLGAENCKCRG